MQRKNEKGKKWIKRGFIPSRMGSKEMKECKR